MQKTPSKISRLGTFKVSQILATRPTDPRIGDAVFLTWEWSKHYRDNWSPAKSPKTKNLGINRIADVLSRGRHVTGLTFTVSERTDRSVTMSKWGWTNDHGNSV